MNLGALIATLGVNTAGLKLATTEMKTFGATSTATITAVNAKLAASGAIMKKFGRNMSMFVTAPIALIGGAAFKMHKDFEASMTKIISLVGVAREQVDKWSEDILRIAPALGKAPKELADALFFITSAGIRGADAMDVLTASAKASAVGLGETMVVADLVTSAMNAYGIETLSAAKATDVLVAVVREGKAQADELAGSMGMVLPIASAMGVAFNEVGAAVAAMTRTGTKAQTASMQLRQILAALIKPSKQAADAMKYMKTSATELRKTIREDGLLKALMDIKDLSEIYGETVMSKVFPNIRALSGVLDLTGDNLEATKKIFKELTNVIGDNERAFAEASKTVEFKWNAAISAGKVALTKLGKTFSESFIPILENIVEKLGKATEWFDGLSDSQKKLGLQITLVMAVIGPLSLALGFIATSILPGLIRMFYATAASVTTLNAVMLANPILALGVAIAAAAAALVIFNRRANEAIIVQNRLSKAQKEYNGLVTSGLRMKEPVKSIKQGMNIIKSLNDRQLKDLQKQIQDRIMLEEDHTAELVTQWDIREKENDMYVGWMSSSNELLVKEAQKYLRSTRSEWRKEIVTQKVFNRERIALMEANLEKVKRVLADLEAAGKKDTSLASVNAVVQELEQQMATIDLLAQEQGGKFDAVTAAANAYNTAMVSLAGIGTTAAITQMRIYNPLLDGHLKTLDDIVQAENAAKKAIKDAADAKRDATKAAQEYSQALSALNRDMGFTQIMGDVLGDEMMVLNLEYDLAIDKLKQMYLAGQLNSAMWDDQIAKIRELYDLLNTPPKITIIQEIGQSIGNVFGSLSQYFSAQMQNQINAVREYAKERNKSEEWVAKETENIQRKLGKKMKALAIAEAIINGAIAITSIMRKWAWNPIVAGILTGLTTASTAIQIAAISAQPMAEGGTIPPGYPNDTYPALLTSGEKVTPPGKLGNDNINVTVKVEGVARGEDLHYIVKEVERRYENSY